jgi:hypothetical protein
MEGEDVSVLEDLRARLGVRREELQRELTEVLPEVERLSAEIASQREEKTKFERRRDVLASFGAKPIPIPQPDAVVLEVSPYFNVEVAPLMSKETGAAFAKRVQGEIDVLSAAIRASEKEIQRLMRGRS